MPHFRDQPISALEIGSFEGRSACWMMENLLCHSQSRLACVDPWNGNDATLGAATLAAEHRFDFNTQEYAGLKLYKCKCTSLEFLTARHTMPRAEHFDLIYVDGSHEGIDALTDLLLCWPLVTPGGFLVFDDYNRDAMLGLRVQPKQAWDAFMSMHPPDIFGTMYFGRQAFLLKR